MGFWSKMENRFGRRAIPNLIVYLMILYVGGLMVYLIDGKSTSFYWQYLCLDMNAILHGQIWRILTYLMYPPSFSLLWFALLMFIYYSLGRTLERLWGSFYFNLFIFIGVFANVIASLIVYLLAGVTGVNFPLTADSLYMSMLLAYAITIPEASIYIMGILPIRAKYLAIVYAFMIFWDFLQGAWYTKIELLASFANVLVFFLLIRQPVRRVQQVKRRIQFEQKVRSAEKSASARPRHVCAVCGRTSETNPELEFRYCSKCTGGREYCMDHLYTHIHT